MSHWTETDQELQKTFAFRSFQEAMDWMAKASEVIEKVNHHPSWTNEYNLVHVRLTTHDEGNTVTEKDRELARALDRIESTT